MIDPQVPALYREPARQARIALVARSFQRLLGRELVPLSADPVIALWQSPLAIVAHGTEDDPVFFFGNRAALTAFDADVETFAAMPSRLSAEAPDRAARQALLDRVTRHGFIDDYAGIRVTTRGVRFAISDAVVWNLIDADGQRHGQAACFAR